MIENETPYTADTIRLVLRQPQDTLLGLGLVLTGAALGAGMVGWSTLWGLLSALPVYRTIQFWFDLRGWIALLIFSVVFVTYHVWEGNYFEKV